MKTFAMRKFYLLFAAIIILSASCTKQNVKKNTLGAKHPTNGKGQTIFAASNYNTSLQAWATYKTSIGNSYKYTVLTSSFAGFETLTTITVVNGSISARDYFYYTYTQSADNTLTRNLGKEWHETTANLGTHASEGAELLTLDQVYTKAQNVWLKADEIKNDVYFEAKNSGLISYARYVPKGCMDDCFTGIMITEISKL
jgi:hypothetical protein